MLFIGNTFVTYLKLNLADYIINVSITMKTKFNLADYIINVSITMKTKFNLAFSITNILYTDRNINDFTIAIATPVSNI